LLVVGIVRNGGSHLRRDIERIGASIRGFSRLRWLIVESDSTDGTVGQLRGLERALPEFRFISLGALSHVLPKRTQRLAHCRNSYLKEVRDNPMYQDISYVVVADLDGCNSLLTESGFRSCFEAADWDMCSANQRGAYYDVWALRHPAWSPNDCWAQYRFLERMGSDPEAALQAAVYSRMIRVPEDARWIPVDSAFGGFAIYRRDAFFCGTYVGLGAEGEEVCEHVAFNLALTAKGHRLYINPRLINGGSNEHTRARGVPQRIRRRISRLRVAIARSLSGSAANPVAH
jgi:hypothetical protein